MDVWECIYTRRSERRFKGEEGKQIPGKDIETILDAARHAYGINDVPQWRFLLIRDQDTKNLIANFAQEVAHMIFGSSYEVFSGHIWYIPERSRLAIAEYTQTGELWKYPIESSFVIIPCITKGAWFEVRTPYFDQSAAATGMAIQNMWLTAHNLGWGAGCNAMPLNDIRRREIFSAYTGVPLSWQMAAAYCFGDRTSARHVGPSRSSLEGIAFSEHWGVRYIRKAFLEEVEEISVPKKDIMDTIKGVGHCYKFDDSRKVPDWMIEKMIHAAIWTPNPENLNHWRHIIIKDEKTKQFLAESTKEGFKLYYGRSFEELRDHHPHIHEDKLLEYAEWMLEEGWKYPLEADSVILTIFAKDWTEYPHIAGTLPGGTDYIWSTATGTAIQTLRLAANALGLETQIDLYTVGEFRKTDMLITKLGIPDSWIPLTMLAVGYKGDAPDVVQMERPKFPTKNLVFDEVWGIPHETL